MRTLMLAVTICLVFVISGCADQHVKIEGELIEATRKLNDELEKVTNKATADSAAAKIKKLNDELDVLLVKEGKLGPASDAADNEIDKKYGDQLKKENARLKSNSTRIISHPETNYIFTKVMMNSDTK